VLREGALAPIVSVSVYTKAKVSRGDFNAEETNKQRSVVWTMTHNGQGTVTVNMAKNGSAQSKLA